MQRNTGYFPTESLEPSGNRLFSRSALNEGDLFRGSLIFRNYLSEKEKVLALANSILEGYNEHTDEDRRIEAALEMKQRELTRLQKRMDNLIEMRADGDLNSVYTRSGQNSTPNSNATNLHSSQKRCCSFCISSSNASPTFQVQKSIFHQMTKPIQVTVILPLLLAISFSRNDDIHSSISGISNDLIGVIPTIGQ